MLDKTILWVSVKWTHNNSMFICPLSYYSCVMFRGQVERKASNIKQLLVYSDRNVIVAINTECLHLFTDNSPRVSLKTQNYMESNYLSLSLHQIGYHAISYI